MPPSYFEWDDELVSWHTLLKEIETRELSKYELVASFIDRYREKSVALFDLFYDTVITPNCPIADADIILSTVHAAKGLEFDRVMVVWENGIELNKFYAESYWFRESLPISPPSPNATNSLQFSPDRLKWRAGLDWCHYGDMYNILYVALTRSKFVLSLPSAFIDILDDLKRFDTLHAAGPTGQNYDLNKSVFTYEDIQALRSGLYAPWSLMVGEQLQGKGLMIDDKVYS